VTIIDLKLYKKSFPFICDKCEKFAHTKVEFCETCGAQAMRKAKKEDYAKVLESME
jgi:rRNA maturation endonuclease Nob1